MINKSKIFEVYESEHGKKRQLYTLNLVLGKKVYGENIVTQDGIEYREWDASKSKLASAIIRGSQNVGIRKNATVLYLGCASGTTVSHVSDMIGGEGAVFAVDIAPRVMRDMVFLSYLRKNIFPVLADANKTDILKERIFAVDVFYQDVAQKNQVEIFMKNVDLFLKDDGYALFAVKARSVDVTRQPRQIFKEVKERLEKQVTIIDYRELDPFQKDHCMFICKKRTNSNSKS